MAGEWEAVELRLITGSWTLELYLNRYRTEEEYDAVLIKVACQTDSQWSLQLGDGFLC